VTWMGENKYWDISLLFLFLFHADEVVESLDSSFVLSYICAPLQKWK
jgi:hypothetical protein